MKSFKMRDDFTRLCENGRGGAWGVVRRLCCSASVLLAVPFMGDVAHAASPEDSSRPSLMIMPFDLTDNALDERPGTVQDLRHWVSVLPVEIRKDLDDKSAFDVHTADVVAPDFNGLAEKYQHPAQCRPCMLALGRKAGMHYILIGSVEKLSTLLVFLSVEIIDVKTGKTVAVNGSRSDGAVSAIMWTRIAQNLADQIQHVHI
ncbi:DUF2380 domain-containing protein [Acidomonas methanolica]|uniref:DUF2380 domain-containing protein n=1 Tax=Acidomonas methanolica NBRC 104435 TaxID=1231351 RepID=A0A023D0V7_ACIMT|nr:DUF2380 domain-containing protein [Acidomonas methanolica]MBU2653358.1 DUF3280 domain-containing protein [Acidomonas methanolica]TCS32309.1 uncharacterized protein DUF2380 [Acidomonas methanolica]GAJ27684.1 hypothetical protein Amme_005_072 [Acidomonas methanolica NBRC 104435]GBQ48038.1 hypothetical protein AA0498_0673 [Acidomonas methanolica]GEK97746.1 hypothetical protein AME01nite_02450 [Acidomonas methanolica NBRC 104435]